MYYLDTNLSLYTSLNEFKDTNLGFKDINIGFKDTNLGFKDTYLWFKDTKLHLKDSKMYLKDSKMYLKDTFYDKNKKTAYKHIKMFYRQFYVCERK